MPGPFFGATLPIKKASRTLATPPHLAEQVPVQGALLPHEPCKRAGQHQQNTKGGGDGDGRNVPSAEVGGACGRGLQERRAHEGNEGKEEQGREGPGEAKPQRDGGGLAGS